MSPPLLRLAFVGGLVGSTACTGYWSTAAAVRDRFVSDATCPADRVTVSHAGPRPPPADVAADPARLALWNSQAEDRSDYVARGCGQQTLYHCDPYGEPPYHYQCVILDP